MLQGEHFAILLTFIKLPFVIEIFVLSFLSGCFTQVLLYSVNPDKPSSDAPGLKNRLHIDSFLGILFFS